MSRPSDRKTLVESDRQPQEPVDDNDNDDNDNDDGFSQMDSKYAEQPQQVARAAKPASFLDLYRQEREIDRDMLVEAEERRKVEQSLEENISKLEKQREDTELLISLGNAKRNEAERRLESIEEKIQNLKRKLEDLQQSIRNLQKKHADMKINRQFPTTEELAEIQRLQDKRKRSEQDLASALVQKTTVEREDEFLERKIREDENALDRIQNELRQKKQLLADEQSQRRVETTAQQFRDTERRRTRYRSPSRRSPSRRSPSRRSPSRSPPSSPSRSRLSRNNYDDTLLSSVTRNLSLENNSDPMDTSNEYAMEVSKEPLISGKSVDRMLSYPGTEESLDSSIRAVFNDLKDIQSKSLAIGDINMVSRIRKFCEEILEFPTALIIQEYQTSLLRKNYAQAAKLLNKYPKLRQLSLNPQYAEKAMITFQSDLNAALSKRDYKSAAEIMFIDPKIGAVLPVSSRNEIARYLKL